MLLVAFVVGGAFGIDRYLNPYQVPHTSMPRYNWAFERKYKQLGKLGGGWSGFVVKCVRRDDLNGK